MDINLLPDEALQQAVKGGVPGVPGWIALSTLAKRNAERATAPVQAPTSTIADKVTQSLNATGVAPQQQSPLFQKQAQPAAQTQAQPTQKLFAKGGPVKMATGDAVPPQPPGYLDMVHSLQLAPDFDPSVYKFTPAAYTPTVNPGPTTLAGAQAQTSPLFGKGPDYNKTIGDLQGIDPAHPNAGLGNFILNLLGGIGQGRGGFQQNFLGGLDNANKLEEEGNQKLFDNQISKQNSIRAAQEAQGTQAHEAATAALSLLQHNQTIADAQDKAKYEAARGNEEGRLQAQQMADAAKGRQYAAAMQLQALLSDPSQASTLKAYAIKNGHPEIADVATDAITAANAQRQKEADIAMNARLAEINAQKKAEIGNMLFKTKLDGLKTGVNPLNGELVDNRFDDLVEGIKNYDVDLQGRLQSKDADLYGAILRKVKQQNPNWKESNFQNIARLQNNLTNGDDSKNLSAGRTGLQHLRMASDAFTALGNGNMPLYNELKNKFASAVGDPQVAGYHSIDEMLAGELGGIVAKGSPTVSAIDAMKSILTDSASPEQAQGMKGVFRTVAHLTAGKFRSVNEKIAQTPGITKDNPIWSLADLQGESRRAARSFGIDPDEATGYNERNGIIPDSVKKAAQGIKPGQTFDIRENGSHWKKNLDGSIERQ